MSRKGSPGSHPRDMVGYGPSPPDPHWPGNARVALQFVLNYEEGAERCVLEGDTASETFLSEMANPAAFAARHMSMESLYEYGSRAGVWRLLRIFEQRRVPLTVFGVGLALERNPEVTAAFVEAGHEIAGHGWRWISYQDMDEKTEREHIARAVETIERLTGARPLGWYTGRDSPNTRRLVVEHGGFLYDSDSYADDLPYWQVVHDMPHLIVPYTLDCNDMRFASSPGFATGQDFYSYLRDTFDTLYQEGEYAPRMMSIGLHCRLAGKPGRSSALEHFLDHVQRHENVWICQRVEIARHWLATHPFPRSHQ